MEYIGIIIFGLIFLLSVIFIVRIPIIIAKHRGISGSELTTISILSWVSLIIGITWLIALVLSLVWQPKTWIDKSETDQSNKLETFEALDKLSTLKEKGIITEAEFQAQKAQLLK